MSEYSFTGEYSNIRWPGWPLLAASLRTVRRQGMALQTDSLSKRQWLKSSICPVGLKRLLRQSIIQVLPSRRDLSLQRLLSISHTDPVPRYTLFMEVELEIEM